MQAIVYRRYGSPDVLHLEDIPTPVPGDNEVLVRVRAASVNPLDWHFMRGSPYGLRFATGLTRPKKQRLGMDLAGTVQAIGGNVTQFKVADEVFGVGHGAFAEYACAPQSTLVGKPAIITFEQAASVPIAALTALQCLRDKGNHQPGQKVLVNGAAGGVGTFAVQIAAHLGAEVTGVCSTRNVELVRALGAHHLMDYTQQDFTQSAQRYDIFIDCIGNRPLSACRRVLTPKGIYIIIGGPSGRWIAPMDRVLRALALSPFVSQRLVFFSAKIDQPGLALIAGLMAAGTVTSVIDRTYALGEVSDAIRYLEEGHARGKVLIAVG